MFKDIAGWFNNGGPFMWVILAVFAFAVAVAVERLIFYYFICGRRGAQQVASLARLINEKKVEEAKRVVFNKSDPLSVLLYTAVDRFSNSMNIEEIREGVEEAAIQQVPRLSQRLNYLSLFANVATLLGLLGTITGLQLSFSSLASIEHQRQHFWLVEFSGYDYYRIRSYCCSAVYGDLYVLYNTQNQLVKDLDEAVVRFLNYLKKTKSS